MQEKQRQWLQKFFEHLHIERRLSKNTLSSYQRDLKQLSLFCESQTIKQWREFSERHVRDFVAKRHRQSLSGRSIQRELSAIRRFCDYLVREAVIKHNPAKGVSSPKYQKPLPKPIDVDQMGQLLKSNAETPIAKRDLAMLELMYSSGLRLSELVGVNINDIDLRDATLPVAGKGSKTRVLPVGRMAIDRVLEWLKVRDEMAVPDEPALFVSNRGGRMSVRAVQQRMHQWGIKQGIASQVHPHRLRHSFASHMLESSGDLRAVQELLGHADISTTQVYTHLDFQHLAKVYDEAHPRARKK